MFNSSVFRIATVALCAMAVVSLGATFLWTGGPSGNWDDESEWTSVGCTTDCFPHLSSDDAVFSNNAQVTLENDRGIDDLSISDLREIPTTFTTDDETRKTVTCDSITISSGWVKVTDLACLKTT